jgi:hypothetical protein
MLRRDEAGSASRSGGLHMSAIGAAFARGVASLGGPQVAAAIVVGGIVVGGLGGAYAGSRSSGQAVVPGGELAVYPCPNQGPALLAVKGGQKLLATGRTEDGTWLRIHYPLPGRTEAWVQSSPLTVAGAVASLPVAACAPEVAMAPPDVAPLPPLTAIQNNTPSPPPTPTPAPEPTPSPTPNAGPSLTALTVSTRKISYDTGAYCPTAVKKVTFKVKASDVSGVDGVTLFWREPGASAYARSAMTQAAGTAASGTWQVTLDTKADGITRAGKLAYYAVATDTGGATRRIPTSGSSSITVAVCANTGPTITSASSSSGSSLSWDPLGVGSCRTATNITAVVKDIDGVKSVTLFYRRPGSTAWSSKPMDNTTVKGKWYANLDTLGDKIAITSPPTDSLSWYIKAVDSKDKAAQTKTASITIKRCDTEATFDGGYPLSQTYSCTSATIAIGIYAGDRDQPEHGLKVVFHWTLTNPRTGAGPISGQMTAGAIQGSYYQGTTGAFNGKEFYAGRLTVYAVTTDKYRGTTTSPTTTSQMACR